MSKLIDLTGQDFGYWHVIERAENSKDGRARWLCQCTKCNETIKAVQGAHLRSGKSTQCTRCRQKVMTGATVKNEEGKTYGFLQVIRKATEEEKPRNDRVGVYWICNCLKCGRKNIPIFGDYLRNGDSKSCGCLNSYNESKICQMLDNLNIKYKTQVSFDDLFSKRKCDKLYFDIGIYNDKTLLYIIEYDGVQHFNNKHQWKEDGLEIIHENDLLKNQYCFEHNIPIIRIPYNQNYTLNDLKIETTKFLLTKENEEIYYTESNFDKE